MEQTNNNKTKIKIRLVIIESQNSWYYEKSWSRDCV